MYTLKHPNIIKLLNHFEEENNIYLVIEFAEGGMLYKHLFD
jgi:serine/threonine protein kinase